MPTVFDNDDPNLEPTPNTPPENPDEPNYYEEYVGEGRKFKDAIELARAKHESDQFIEKLKQEAKELRGELDKRLTTEQVLEKLKEGISPNNRHNDPLRDDEDVETDTKQSLQEKDIEAKFKEMYSSERAAERTKRNVEQANEALIGYYGSLDEAAKAVAAKSKELGFTVDELQATGGRSPDALYALMGLDRERLTKQKPSSNPSHGTLDTEAATKGQDMTRNGRHTYQYYQQILKENPRRYFSPDVQNQMFKDSVALKDEFYG